MASFKIEYKPSKDEVVKTLIFKKHKYSEVWQENRCLNPITFQMCHDYPRLFEDIEEILNVIMNQSDDEDVMQALEELEEYE